MMKRRLLAFTAMMILAAAGAQAADTVRTEVTRADGYVRIVFTWPETEAEAPIAIDANVDNQVLVARFSREVAIDTDSILQGMSAEAALARMDADGRTLRLALRTPARAHVSRSYNMLAVDLQPPEAADPPGVISPRAEAEAEALRRQQEAAALPPPPAPPPPPLAVRRASSPAFDRIVFDWPQHTEYRLIERDGDWLLRFSRDAAPDLASLRADPPARLSLIEAMHEDGELIVRVVPAPDSAPRVFRERNAIVMDLAAIDSGDNALLAQLQELAEAAGAGGEAPDADAPALPEPPPDIQTEFSGAPAPEAAPEPVPAPAPETRAAEAAPAAEPVSADPVPESGVVAVKLTTMGPDLLLEFGWAAPAPAAAFRRAGAIWIVFGAEAELDISEIQRGQRHVTDVQTLRGPGWSALRIVSPETTQVSPRGEAGSARWTFALAEGAERAPAPVRIERRTEEDDAATRLFALLPGPGAPVRIPDPGVGDTLLVVPAHAPARGVLEQRDFLSFSVLPSAHGLAMQTLSSGLSAERAQDGVWINPPRNLSPPNVAQGERAAGQIVFVTGETAASFDRARADVEIEAAEHSLPDAQIAMARFLLSRELAIEALGMFALAAERDVQLATRPDFRAQRGAANALAGRWREAETDLSLPALDEDPSAQLWRAWVRTETGDWAAARRAFVSGEAAIASFAPQWRARFHEAFARSALALNDLTTAKRQIDLAAAEISDTRTAQRIALTSAQWREAAGQPDDALDAYDQLAQSGDEEVEARAILAAARLRHDLGRSGVEDLIETLESLRWRWRGDDIELETIRTLGRVYVDQNQHRQGLEAMKAVVARFPDHPVARGVFSDMMGIFSQLFLEGGADRLDPVEALALYFQFSDLTPIGAEGDRMIRRLSERLVAFDLLPQAAELLQHQVDQRLHEPRTRAQVAADLALIYLMDRQPEAALRTLRGTRVTQLPPALAEERRITEARALAELNAHDSALDLVAGDPSAEAARLRANVAWKQRDWPLAAQRLEELLGERWNGPGPLGAEDAAAVLRAVVAHSLANDREGLRRMVERYGALMRETPDWTAFAAVTQELETSGLRLAEIADRAADVAALEAFLERRRGRLEPQPAPPAPGDAALPVAGGAG